MLMGPLVGLVVQVGTRQRGIRHHAKTVRQDIYRLLSATKVNGLYNKMPERQCHPTMSNAMDCHRHAMACDIWRSWHATGLVNTDKYIVGCCRCEVSHNGTKGSLTLDSCLERKFGVSTAIKVAVLPSPDVPVWLTFQLLYMW